jgi:hypothetical protein
VNLAFTTKWFQFLRIIHPPASSQSPPKSVLEHQVPSPVAARCELMMDVLRVRAQEEAVRSVAADVALENFDGVAWLHHRTRSEE